MATIKPFKAVRPRKRMVQKVVSLPYDVFTKKEARRAVENNPDTFLKIARPETAFPEDTDMYSDKVYEKAKNLLNGEIEKGVLKQEKKDCYFVYRLTMGSHSQTGLVACFAVDDAQNGIIKKHEKTRHDKEEDRTKHIDVTNAQTGPVYLAYKEKKAISDVIEKITEGEPLYDFVAGDGVHQQVWRVDDVNLIDQITKGFENVNAVYVADGHHRCASAEAVCKKRRAERPGYDGGEEFNYFLAIAFPENQLKILPYNRVIKDLNGLSLDEFLHALTAVCDIKELGENYADEISVEAGMFGPKKKGEIDMYVEGKWYQLKLKPEIFSDDAVEGLDVSLLQNNILAPILGIEDPRKDDRIDFVGGIRGLKGLEERCHDDMQLAFALHPTSMSELIKVTDEGRLMPPKSTWFEPKLQSGLFVHKI